MLFFSLNSEKAMLIYVILLSIMKLFTSLQVKLILSLAAVILCLCLYNYIRKYLAPYYDIQTHNEMIWGWTWTVNTNIVASKLKFPEAGVIVVYMYSKFNERIDLLIGSLSRSLSLSLSLSLFLSLSLSFFSHIHADYTMMNTGSPNSQDTGIPLGNLHLSSGSETL